MGAEQLVGTGGLFIVVNYFLFIRSGVSKKLVD